MDVLRAKFKADAEVKLSQAQNRAKELALREIEINLMERQWHICGVLSREGPFRRGRTVPGSCALNSLGVFSLERRLVMNFDTKSYFK